MKRNGDEARRFEDNIFLHLILKEILILFCNLLSRNISRIYIYNIFFLFEYLLASKKGESFIRDSEEN